MGCCGSLNSSSTGLPPILAIPPEGRGQRFMQPAENVECWAARTQTTDDKSGGTPPPGKIITASIAIACDLTINQTIEAYPSPGATTTWDPIEWSPQPSFAVTETPSGNSLKLSGNLSNDENTTFEVKATANFSDGTSDTKTYTIKATKCNPDEDSITLTNPFPGSRITAPFNEIRPKTGGGTRAHKGLDFGNGGGTGPCVAAADGIVLSVNANNLAGPAGMGGYGYYVTIQHSNKTGKPMCNTLYAHLASISTSPGAKVAKGQQIGMVGGSGKQGLNSYTPHLHFELHIAGSCKDPVPYMEPKPPVKAGVNNSTIGKGDPPAPAGSSANYGSAPPPGSNRTNPDGSFESTPTAGENKGNAINTGTIETAGSQCIGKEEPPLDPATPDQIAEQPCIEMVTLEQLQKIMPTSGDRANQYIGHINKVIKEDVVYDLPDQCGEEAKRRIRMFLAQIGHESGELRYMSEIASGSAYEGRSDLGNTSPGDGVKYKGRGAIQLTGKANYRQFGNAIGQDLVSNPGVVATDDYLSIKAAGWYWRTKKLNNATTLVAATKKINGGTNGLADRERKWAKANTAIV